MFQLKEAFHAMTDRRKKLQILTLSPHSIKEMKTFFATSTIVVKTSCQLKKDDGILPVFPSLSKGRVITSAEKEAVYAFYESDEVNRPPVPRPERLQIRERQGNWSERKKTKMPCSWKSP